MKKVFNLILFAVIFCMTAGMSCKQQRSDLLQSQVQHYHEAYRWGEWAMASHYVKNPEEFLRKTEAFGENLEVLDYQVLRYSVNPNGFEAEVEVIRRYHILPSVVVEKQKLVQQWQYVSERKNWFLVSPY